MVFIVILNDTFVVIKVYLYDGTSTSNIKHGSTQLQLHSFIVFYQTVKVPSENIEDSQM